MQSPHPLFKDFKIPIEFSLGSIKLKALSVDDLDRDYEAVMSSASDIKALNPRSNWPVGLTKQQNLIDLAWHQKEFQAQRSFAWVIENENSEYLGCLYVYPSINGDKIAEVAWWWRTGVKVDKSQFKKKLELWLNRDDWPSLEYRLPTYF